MDEKTLRQIDEQLIDIANLIASMQRHLTECLDQFVAVIELRQAVADKDGEE